MKYTLMDSRYTIYNPMTRRSEVLNTKDEALALLDALKRMGYHADLEIKERIRVSGWQDLKTRS